MQLQSNWASEAGKEKMHKNKQRRDMETKDEEMDFRKIMKDIEFLGFFFSLIVVNLYAETVNIQSLRV